MSIVPPTVVFLAKHPMVSNYDLSSIKGISSGAAPLSRDVIDEFNNRISLANSRQGRFLY